VVGSSLLAIPCKHISFDSVHSTLYPCLEGWVDTSIDLGTYLRNSFVHENLSLL
jgi:hypothetical protein